ncbi:hypothetical protein GGI23_007637, partial [Coemansia sp. RSA 2559]
MQDIREEAAKDEVKTLLKRDNEGVFDLAVPVCEDRRHAAETVAKRITQQMLSDKLSNELSGLNMLRSTAENAYIEKDVYVGFTDIVLYVARKMNEHFPAKNASDGYIQPLRLVLPSAHTDFKCRDADDGERIDIGLEPKPLGTPVSPVNLAPPTKKRDPKDNSGYKDLLLIVEAKVASSPAEFYQAYIQLFTYTRMIYETQRNRRFAWGMVVCKTHVEICIFGPNFAISSPSFDMADDAGCQRLVQLLVNWSFCEDHLLGYDTTVTYNAELACWEIQVPANTADNHEDPAGELPSPNIFYSKKMVFNSDRLFGRHNRCFLATKVKPDKVDLVKATDDGDDLFNVPSEDAFIIKDAWPE